MATPDDDDLLTWTKSTSNPLINGRPSGLSDDFRDPYFFRNGDDAYLIVGTSKDGRGAVTLHKMDPPPSGSVTTAASSYRRQASPTTARSGRCPT